MDFKSLHIVTSLITVIYVDYVHSVTHDVKLPVEKLHDMESLNNDILNIHLDNTKNECPLCETTSRDAMEMQKHLYLEYADDSKKEQEGYSEEYLCSMCNLFQSDKYEKLIEHFKKCLSGNTTDKKNNNGANKKQIEKMGDDGILVKEMERDISNKSNSSINKPLLEYLIDVDGFYVNGDFVVKELGILHIPTRRGFNYYFRVGNFKDLTHSDKKIAAYLRNNIHGLKFEDDPFDLPQEKIFTVLQNLIKDIECRNTGGVISYKGGNMEVDLLTNLDYFKAVNIEEYGCPTFNVLLEKYNENILNLFNIPRCTRHQNNENNKILHCPLLEIVYFTYWLYDNNIVTILESTNENENEIVSAGLITATRGLITATRAE